MGGNAVRLSNIDFNGEVPKVYFISGQTGFNLTLDELDDSLHHMMRARHMMMVHKDHDGCPDCTLNAMGKLGGA